MDQLAGWLIDYFVSASVLLAVAVLVGSVIRQPSQRQYLSWAALTGLAVLALLCAAPVWPRLPLLLPIPSQNHIAKSIASSDSLSNDKSHSVLIENRIEPSRHVEASKTIVGTITDTQTTTMRPATFVIPDMRSLAAEMFCAGAGIVLLWLALGAVQTQRLFHRAKPAPDFAQQELRALVDRLCEPATSGANSKKAVPRLLVTQQIDTAAACGALRPAIFLPSQAVADENPHSLRMLLAHELAHIRRGDLWLLALCRVLLIALFAHPLYWWMRRRIRMDQEFLADALGAELCGRERYAENLVAWAKRPSTLRPRMIGAVGILGIRERPGHLSRRVVRLLDHRIPLGSSCSTGWRFGVAAMTAVLIVGLSLFTVRPATVKADSPPAEAAKTPTEQPPKTISITGKCLDETRKPMAGARVRLFFSDFFYDDRSQRELRETLADADGAFELKDVDVERVRDRHGELVVVGQAPGRATACYVVSPDQIHDQRVELALQPAGGALSGTIVDAAGKPVSGAIVSASPCGLIEPVPGIYSALTDDKGHYSIIDVALMSPANQAPQPGGKGEVWTVTEFIGQVQHPDYARQMFRYTKIPGTANATLQKAAIVEGNIVLPESGKPAVGVQLEFSNDIISGDYWTRAKTDEHGHYRLATLPPGKYYLSATLTGRPNLFKENVKFQSGENKLDLKMAKGGAIAGHIIDVTTGKPPVLDAGQRMSVSSSLGGMWHNGMASAEVQPDGTFKLLVQPGNNRFGFYFGPNYRPVNTDKFLEKGVDVAEGQTVEVEARVKPYSPDDDKPPKPLTPEQAAQLSEQAAIAAITKLGGWVKTEKIDGQDHVIEVNMVYHEDDENGRKDNRVMSDECLFYVRKFPKLKGLFLHGTQATDAALKQLRGMKSLETVMIWDASNVSDAGAAHLATLPNLKEIFISDDQLTDKPPAYRQHVLTDSTLRAFSQMPHLENISLEGGRFTDAGLGYLKNMTQLKQLGLGLGKIEITNAGLRNLSHLINLELLDLQGAKITDDGLPALKDLKNLKDLWLNNTAVTKEGFENLRKSLPKLKDEGYPGWQPNSSDSDEK